MPRRRPSPRKQRAVPPLPQSRRIETGPDGYDYEVRPVSAARATKTYRCPGCDHEIRPGTAHVLVWPADRGEQASEDRRHWHTPCWTHRGTRGPTRKWS
ncbi:MULTISPECIES: hypothetical protein [Mycobacterium]|uniref:hypothetical protein n=1 Tax=Mycobacterium TaxID=1763 RepID=UPI0013D0D965|nr:MULTISPECIES: hypothetical protein [Mycobacterium]MDV3130419.1 hypothetical protein [Mycobacterium sp. 29Ha]